MRKPTLIEGVLVAGALCAAGVALSGVAPHARSGVIAALAYLHVLYLLARARSRVGKLSLGLMNLAVLGSAAIFLSGLETLLVAAGVIWITRSLYAYPSIKGMAIDAFIGVLAIGWATGAWTATGSMLWALWCFFLAQALSALIPAGHPSGEASTSPIDGGDAFARAHSAAEAAIRQLAARER